jgi:DNA-binding transcriptional LysR family regulator
LVEEGVDVAVRIGELADSSLVAIKLGVVSRVVVASPAYLKTRGVPKSPAELAGHDIVAFEGLGATSEWRFQGGKPVRLQPRLTVNSIDTSIAAAEAGVGITRPLSYQVQASVMAGRLTPILQHFAPPPLPVTAIYPARRIASANIAAFIKAARGYFKAHPLVPVEEWRRGAPRKPIAK